MELWKNNGYEMYLDPETNYYKLKELNFDTDLVINYHEHLIEEYILTPHEQYIKGTK